MTDNKGQNQNNTETEQKVDRLLPPANIHLFSEDLETLNLFHALGEDWRFGRIHMGMRGDNLDEAIEYYARRKSPTLILIQTEETGEEFENKLGELAQHCDEGTAAIVIGPVNDVQLYRHLTSIGVSDYLVAPLETENLVEAIANSLQDIVGAVDSHLMAFVGVNGGVGTTSVATIASHILSDDLKSKTLVLDAAGAQSTLWNQFAFSPSGTLIESARAVVDNDNDALDRLIVKKSDTLNILNSGTENILDNPVAPQAYEMMLDHFLSVYPYVALDTSGAPTQIKRMIISRAHSVVIVTTPRVPDLSQTKMMIQAIKDMPGGDNKKIQIIVNKSGASKSDIGIDDIKEALDEDNIIAINWLPELFGAAENNGESITQQSAYNQIKSSIISTIAEIGNVKKFDQSMQDQMNNSLLSLFNKLKGGA